jgi:integrase
MSRSKRNAAPDRPRYLKVKCKTNKRTEPRVYYFWEPRPEDAEAYGLPRRVRLAADRGARSGDGSAYFQACLEAEEWNAKLDAKRAGGLDDASKIAGTLPYFIAELKKTAEYGLLSKATKSGTYECGFRVIHRWSEVLGHIPVKRIRRGHCRDFYEKLLEPDAAGGRNYAMARNTMATLSRVLSYAIEREEIDVHPMREMTLIPAALRLIKWSDGEIALFAEKARAAGRPSMALAAELNGVIGQRRGDTVVLPWDDYQNGCICIVQGKTGARVQVPVTPELADKLAAAPRHRSGYIVYDEVQDQPYTLRHFSRIFREIADDAGLSHLWFHDLRRTAVYNLAKAGATVPEIVAVTGHSLENATKVLKHYLFPDSEMAAEAIRKLIEQQALERREADQVDAVVSQNGLDLTNVIRFVRAEAA